MAEIPPEEGRLARRLKVFAVSRSDDPRDGFHVYAFVQNTYRDWPWMAIDGDHLILSHQGTRRSAADSPSATLLPLEDVRAGKVRPSFVNFYPRDLGDVFKAEPPRQFGSLPDHSLLVGKRPGEGGDGPWWHVFALPHPGRPYEKRTPGSAVLDDPRIDVSALMEERTAFRDGLLHFTGQRTRKKHHGVHHNEIVYYRVGLTMDGDRPVLSYDEPGFRTMKWGDDLDESTPRSFDQPGVQVNSAGDVFVTFGRGGAADGPFVSEPADVMYTLWQHAAVVPAPITLWKEGVEGYDREHTHTVPRKVKALAAAVDPMDGTTFWGIHRFRAKDGSWDTFVGAFTP